MIFLVVKVSCFRLFQGGFQRCWEASLREPEAVATSGSPKLKAPNPSKPWPLLVRVLCRRAFARAGFCGVANPAGRLELGQLPFDKMTHKQPFRTCAANEFSCAVSILDLNILLCMSFTLHVDARNPFKVVSVGVCRCACATSFANLSHLSIFEHVPAIDIACLAQTAAGLSTVTPAM